MALKNRSKVSAEFSMSSLTDIIFLLLIFFMLTSSLVAPNALNLKLPGSSNAKITTTSNSDEVRVRTSGKFYLNRKQIDLDRLERELSRRKGKSNKKYSFIISPDKGTPTEHVVAIMDIALRLDIDGVLAMEK